MALFKRDLFEIGDEDPVGVASVWEQPLGDEPREPVREEASSEPAAARSHVGGQARRGAAIERVERLDAGLLAAAGCVVLADGPDRALPARAFAVLAARRLLILPRLETTFGLEDGLDHVEFASPDEAVTLIDAYRRAPEPFARITAWGRVKAEAQRASVVYGRLAQDLRLHGAADRA